MIEAPFRPLAATALILISIAGCATAGSQPGPTELEARIDSVVHSALASRGIPGAAIAVLLRDSLVLANGYGVADRERNTRATTETVFQLASTTKPFTAMAVMMLVEEGKIELDAPAARYLPWVPAVYDRVTVRQLLTHTSGVARDLRRENVDEFPLEEFRRRLDAAPPSFAPGARWEYSNTGYALLSFIVEAASGEEFGAFLRRRIFEPAGMPRTAYRVPETRDGQHAVGYDLVDGALRRAPHVFSGWGNSGIESTVLDMARWVAAIERRQLLRPESYRAMFTRGQLGTGTTAEFPFGGAPSGYGFGWFLTSHEGAQLRTHGGAIAGFSSVVNSFSDEGWTIIVLSNGKQGADRLGQADAIARGIASVLPRRSP